MTSRQLTAVQQLQAVALLLLVLTVNQTAAQGKCDFFVTSVYKHQDNITGDSVLCIYQLLFTYEYRLASPIEWCWTNLLLLLVYCIHTRDTTISITVLKSHGKVRNLTFVIVSTEFSVKIFP
jgi:hypothetical protein